MQNKHNEAFERFVYLYDFKDRNLTANVVGNMQEHLRQLLAIKSQIYSLATELGFIFEGISRVQARREDSDNLETFAIRLDAVSSDISWNMADR
ncbi:uncharacterized protein EI90DRAFT_3034519 [Cantharellus anzutake]|uniref:uncharacterized protein n=1 Tax=Cantharellus anzutake TaxID=1750568 RepID=UPI001905A9C4|nr:uncharacterized protein EI90DRAFT_3034519 [Cantharellus anzutake]KAF8341581.1 hypothetical protein EI90DRAFT_3034519 [Cantharellus anzutake]